jgi:hypothetical protein
MSGGDELGSEQLWRRPTTILGYAENLRGLGGVVSPLLAGFSLAAIAQILTADSPPPLAAWALVAFAACVALLMHAMQLAFIALALDPSPATHLSWFPEALIDERALADLRRRQAEKYDEMIRYFVRTNIAYDLGLNAFLAGVVLLLVPHRWTAPHIAALAVAGTALVLELWWAVANRIERVPHPVLRSPSPPRVVPVRPSLTAAVLDPDRRSLAEKLEREQTPEPEHATESARHDGAAGEAGLHIKLR